MKKKSKAKKLHLKKKTISDLVTSGHILGGAVATRAHSPQQSGSPCGSCMLACQTDGCPRTRYCA